MLGMFAVDRKLALPKFGKLALVGFTVTAPAIAVALMLGYVKAGVSLFGGYVLALVIYGLLYLVVSRGLDALAVDDLSPRDKSGSSMAGFGMVGMMMGKYLVVGLLLFLAWHTGYLLVVPFLIGFVLAQIGITWTSVAQSKKTPLVGPRRVE